MTLNRNTPYPPLVKLRQYYEDVYSDQERIARHSEHARGHLTIPYGWGFEELLRLRPKGTRALDIGCGLGQTADRLLAFYDEVYGTEISKRALSIARERFPRVTYNHIEGNQLPYDNKFFDFIIADQLIEHILPQDTNTFFSEASRVLKRDGKFLISTPNGDELRRRILWLPVTIGSYVFNKPENFLASKLYAIHNRLLSAGTEKARLFAKYELLEHTNVMTFSKIRTNAERNGMKISKVLWDGLVPLFPKLLMRGLMKDACQVFENSLPVCRRLFMANQNILLVKC